MFLYTVKARGSQPRAFSIPAAALPGFVAGTLIATPLGDMPVERLEPGDALLAADGRILPLRSVSRRLPADAPPQFHLACDRPEVLLANGLPVATPGLPLAPPHLA
ncbi:Hint domain-containing protein [Gemmobacter aquatilis]|uniref:Hint domain-containing protein n=1 Tax=Gemmobacter aquatilis TaxID=933059 RepID=A0A1H8CA11_9RHOB|nr:Hint domain-containing protein [Gemmobacter aquatilis]SEM92071.1 Hint domain-containing protein [Gemmobacter aquatilis]